VQLNTETAAGAKNKGRGRPARVAAAAGVVVAGVLAAQSVGHADGVDGRAVLRDAAGNRVGLVRFSEADDGKMLVRAELASALAPGFHGFHAHANAAGAGCVADSSQPASTWFTSVGGHYKEAAEENHGNHAGDLPSLLVHRDGTAHLRFTAERLDVLELDGKALIVHARPDNFGNVPVGAADNQYTPNTPAAVTLTQNTGNAGDRLACGVVEIK
jgi:Cu-Zn family superoxide dismutase